MYRYWISFYFSLFIFISMTTAVFADQPQFRVDSFIPEKFTDLELRVNGGLNSSGSVSNADDPIADNSFFTERSGGSQNLAMGGSMAKRYETIPGFYQIRSSLSVGFEHSNVEYFDEGISDLIVTRRDKGERNGYEYQIAASHFMDVGAYVFKDLFLSGQIEINARYNKTPEYKFTRYSYSKTGYMDDFLERIENTDMTMADDSKYYIVNLEFLPGWGRQYEGVYASTALYMIDELKKNGYLTKMPDYDQMMKLTELIYQNNMKHIIDSRVRRIEALTAICDYLKGENLAGDLDPSGQVILQDVWDYFPRVSRKFGYRFRIGPEFIYNYNGGQATSKGNIFELYRRIDPDLPSFIDTVLFTDAPTHLYRHNKNTVKIIGLDFMFEYHKPLDHYWQLDFTASCTAYLKNKSERENESINYEPDHTRSYQKTTEELKDMYRGDITAAASYIINSRTSLSFSGLFFVQHSKRTTTIFGDNGAITDKITNYPSGTSGRLLLNGNLEYRLAIPTTLKANIGYVISSNGQQYLDGNRANNLYSYIFNASIEHYIF